MQPLEPVNNLYELARHHARVTPDQVAFTFLLDGEGEEAHLSYGELDRQATRIAGKLQALARPRDGESYPPRVLLLFDPGLDYIAAFFGAVYAGMIPVPAYPPDLMRVDRTLPRLQALAADCQAAVVLGTRSSLGLVGGLLEKELAAAGSGAMVLTADDRDSWGDLPWAPPAVRPEAVAFLQYTSGSTRAPRGVMVSHANLLYQMEQLDRRWSRALPHSGALGVTGVSWLPLYHDLGLIGGMLAPFYAGRRMVLLSPLAFIQRPIRWLRAISRYRAVGTGGPNFAYDLCVARFRPEDAFGLDLSSWRIALNGAEPVRAETLDRFAATFAPYGFDARALAPSYGLAEATLGVTGDSDGTGSPRVDFSLAALELHRARVATPTEGRVRRLVGCGHPLGGTEVRIVEPHSRRELGAGEVGEVWVRAPGVALGYWNRPAETEATFNARLAGSGLGPYMRTGDLGFLRDGILYLTGRLRETMIFWGRNVYPQDIEYTVSACHEGLRLNGGAAFAVDRDNQEQLVIVQEVHRPGRLDLATVSTAVRQAVMAEHRVPLSALVLIRAGTLPKTSSGKTQRGEARRKYLAGELDVIASWTFDTHDPALPAPHPPPPGGTEEPLPDELAIQAWLRERIAQAIGVPADQVAGDEPLGHYVMDSITLVSIARDLELWLGRSIAPAAVFDSPTLSCLARRLADPAYHVGAKETPARAVDSLSEGELDRALAELLSETTPGASERAPSESAE